jgi:hypothetical protein
VERAFRILTALVAFAGLGLQLRILLQSDSFDSPALAVWRFLAFFTILTNLVVAVTASVSALAPGSAFGRFVDTAPARAAVLLYIGTVAVIYHLLLANLWDPQGDQLIADQLLHTATPALVAAGWLVFDHKKGLAFTAIPGMLVYPLAYTVYALVRGALDGFYPYFFIDVSAHGYARILMNVAGLTGAFIAGAAIIIALGRMLASFGIRTARPG